MNRIIYIYIFIPDCTKPHPIQQYSVYKHAVGQRSFTYIFYWRKFREVTLFRFQIFNCRYTDTFSITVYLRPVSAVVWVAYLLSVIQFNSFQLIKHDKKGKVIPFTGPVWPRGWVQV